MQHEFYTNQLFIHTNSLAIAKKKHRFFTLARLVAFLLIAASSYFIGFQTWLLFVLIPEIVLFVFLVNKWLDAKIEKEKEELFIELNQAELQVLAGDWSGFDDGSSFKKPLHAFAHDMDLFGPKSVYQYMNRTVLPLGAKRLADTLSEGAKDQRKNQQMIQELAQQMEWMQRFIVHSKVYLKQTEKQHSLNQLKDFSFPKVTVLKWILPIITWSSIALYNFNVITGSLLVLIGMIILAVIGSQLKHSNKWMALLSERADKIQVLHQQWNLFKEVELTTEKAKDFRDKLQNEFGIEEGLKELLQIRKRAEYRMNAVAGLVLNYLFAWDFRVLSQSSSWHQNYASFIEEWELNLAEIEVWISGAVYQFNRGNCCFAEESESFEIQELGHPFVAVGKQVSNSFVLNGMESFLIITGPNMAGKSTYLRSVGLAIISANAGFPILAKACKLPSVKLYSSMRTSDDLTNESSYFHAELSRLRYIMDRIDSGEKVFVILDEILKGTNSKDKEEGSANFLKKLERIGAKGLIATHDLSLTNLSKQIPSFRNVYFDSIIEGDQLYFDYRIRDGVCQNMNASFLLKQMRLVD